MTQVVLPRLVGTREAVGDLLAEQQVDPDLAGRTVVLLCRNVASGSTSFADQLVKEILVDRHADELVVVGAPQRFVSHLRDAASRRNVANKVQVRSNAEVAV